MSFHFNTSSGVEEALCNCATLASDPEPHRLKITVDMATQALLKSLCYDPRGQDMHGSAEQSWTAMVLRCDAAVRRVREQARQGHHHIELSVKDLVRDVVVARDGVQKIAEAIKASWADKKEIATKELHCESGKQDGVVGTREGESMASCVSRRRARCLTTS